MANVQLFAAKYLKNADKIRYKHQKGKLSTGKFYLESARFKLLFQQLPLVALDLNCVTFYRTANATALFQGLGECFEFALGQGHAIDDRHGFAAATLGFPPDAHDAIAGAGRTVLATDAFGYRTMALGAETTGIGAVNEA